MKVYLLSAAAGILVGIIYSILNIRSPAPPLVAIKRMVCAPLIGPVVRLLNVDGAVQRTLPPWSTKR